MTNNKRRVRPQKQKAHVQHVQDLRRSNATSPVPSGKAYQRRPKHAGKGWE